MYQKLLLLIPILVWDRVILHISYIEVLPPYLELFTQLISTTCS
jgi:hypothetical protein